MNRYLRYIFTSVAILTIAACARISSPEGGPVDETPPTLLSSIPNHEQINYQGNTIVLNFDEYVTTQAIENNLIITPKIEGTFRSRIKKRSVILTFDEPWQESTTYNINFGSTIQDLNNKNIPPNLNLSFSTGDFIDSLQISGTITNLYSKEPVDKALVSLYTVTDTLDITSGAASYYAVTDTSGNYQFNNLPDGEYFVYSALDKNNNQQADVDEEFYGFYTDTLKLSSNITGINFDIQQLNVDSLEVSTARHFGRYFDVEFNKAITSYSIVNNDTIPSRQAEPGKIRFYNTGDTYNDTIPIIIQATDSIDSQLQDTVSLYFNESKVDPDKFDYTLSPSESAVLPQVEVNIEFTKPVKSYNRDSLVFEIDSLNFFTLDDSIFTWNDSRTEVSWPLNLTDYINSDQRLNVRLNKGAFISVEQDTSRQTLKGFQLLKSEDSGIINGSVNTDAPNFIIQLLNSRTLEVIQTKHNEKDFSFQFLNAGSYSLKVIIDTNANGVWDIGNILTRTQAEPIVYYIDPFNDSKVIELRKNWEVDDIDVSYQVNNN